MTLKNMCYDALLTFAASTITACLLLGTEEYKTMQKGLQNNCGLKRLTAVKILIPASSAEVWRR